MLAGLCIGLVVGAAIGLLTGCAYAAGGEADDAMQRALIQQDAYDRGWAARGAERALNVECWWRES